MLRFLLTALAALFAARLLFSLFRAIGMGMREGEIPGSRGAAPRGDRPRGAGKESPPTGDPAAGPPAIDRASVIDVAYTEVPADRSGGAKDSARAER
jgi:hypothetical protein